MKGNIKIAKRYAKKLAGTISKEELEDVYEELYGLLQVFEKATEDMKLSFEDYFKSQAVKKEDKVRLVKQVLDKTDVSIEVKQLLLEMAENEHFYLLRQVVSEFKKYVDFILERLKAELISTTEISRETYKFVKEKIEKIFGKKVGLEVKVDPDLIGGFVLKVGDKVLDSSLKTQLELLKRNLIEQQ